MTRAAQRLLRCLRPQAGRFCSSENPGGNTLPVAPPLNLRTPPVQLMDGQLRQKGEGLTIGASVTERATTVAEFNKSGASPYHQGENGSRNRTWEPAGESAPFWFNNLQLPGGTTGTSQPLRSDCWSRISAAQHPAQNPARGLRSRSASQEAGAIGSTSSRAWHTTGSTSQGSDNGAATTCDFQGAQAYYDLLTKDHPVEIRAAGSAGRGVFAIKDFEAGEVILASTPAVAHPSIDSIGKVCYLCLSPLDTPQEDSGSASSAGDGEPSPTVVSQTPEGAAPTTPVSSGGVTPGRASKEGEEESGMPREYDASMFCSGDCAAVAEEDFFEEERRHDWDELHAYCRRNRVKFPLAAKRFICMVLAGSSSPNALSSLCFAHAGKAQRPLPWVMEQYSILMRALAPGSGVPNMKLQFLSEQWYASLVGRFHLNAFKLQPLSLLATAWQGGGSQLAQAASQAVLGEGSVGTGIYLLPSFLNHDCDPNVDISWPADATAFLRARRSITKGEELTITYIDSSIGVSGRHRMLRDAYGFQCSCKRCQEGDNLASPWYS